MLHTLLEFIGLLAAMLAAIFWMTSAFGKTLEWPPWNESKTVPPDQLAGHQAKWNANAAACAGIAACCQALLFLYETGLPPFH
jgi:hypothetical protein